MAYRCSVKRTGTVLYRYGGDLFYALTVSLGEARTRNPEFKDNLSVVCLDLNKKFHSTIKFHYKLSPHNIECVNIEYFVSKIHPDIWKAMVIR